MCLPSSVFTSLAFSSWTMWPASPMTLTVADAGAFERARGDDVVFGAPQHQHAHAGIPSLPAWLLALPAVSEQTFPQLSQELADPIKPFVLEHVVEQLPGHKVGSAKSCSMSGFSSRRDWAATNPSV